MAVNPGYTRRQELRCTVADLSTYSGVILYEGEVLYVKQADGKYAVKIGDGTTNIANLPYVINYSDVATQATNAANSANAASNSASTAGSKALDAEAYAKGTRNGVDVDSSDPAYHNNAEYFKDQASTIAEAKAEEVLEDKADVDGSYEGLHAGSATTASEAQSLSTSVGITDTTPLSAQPVGGSSDVTTGIQNLNGMTGVKVVKNQFAHAFDTTGWTFNDKVTNDSITSGVVTFTANGQYGATYTKSGYGASIKSGHKYFLAIMAKTTKTGCQIRLSNSFSLNVPNTSNSWQFVGGIVTADTSAGYSIYIQDNNASDWAEVSFKNFIFVDLTLRYGSNEVVNAIIGNDSSKYVANLIAFDPNILKDTDYTANPDFSECKVAEMLEVDYNQWDEEWELGSVGSYSSNFASKNIIKVLPNTKYYFYCGSYNVSGYGLRLAYYDSSYNLVKSIVVYDNYFTIPINVRGIKFGIQYALYGQTYKNDISLFIYWDGSRIGYEPYKARRTPLPNVSLNGILKVSNDKVVADGDRLTPDGSVNETLWAIGDLGDYDYTYQSGGYFVSQTAPTGIKSATVVPDIGCTKYTRHIYEWYTALNDKEINACRGALATNVMSLCIKDTAYNDATAFKTAVTGVKFMYPLETPTTLTAPTFSSTFYGDDFGTMWLLDEDGNVIDGLCGMDIFYKANVAGFAESLYIEADGDPDAFAKTANIPTAVATYLAGLTGYDASKTQTLKNVEGTLTWVDDE